MQPIGIECGHSFGILAAILRWGSCGIDRNITGFTETSVRIPVPESMSLVIPEPDAQRSAMEPRREESGRTRAESCLK